MEETTTKIESSEDTDNHKQEQWKNLKPWKPGQSGNPKGRPKGKTMKEYARDYLARMTSKERIQFLKSMSPEFVWRMAEGNPDNKSDIKGEGFSAFFRESIARDREIYK